MPIMRTRLSFLSLLVVSWLLLGGCGGGDSSSTATERQEKALKDPFSYSPDLKQNSTSVTGNGDKDALKRDVDHVFNP
jgi:hypothetical protein